MVHGALIRHLMFTAIKAFLRRNGNNKFKIQEDNINQDIYRERREGGRNGLSCLNTGS